MITKYINFINESLLNKMKGKTKDDVWKSLGYENSFNTPEDFLLTMFDGINILKETPTSIFYGKKGEILF